MSKKIILLLFLFMNINFLVAQETDAMKQKPIELNSPRVSGSRGYTGVFSKINSTSVNGLAKNLRFTVHDGNLIHGGITNTGLLSRHYVSGTPRISWPKGPSSVEYLHGAVFYVAGEVFDEAGDTVHIVSDNYRRSQAETSIDKTHFYAFGPLSKYFNSHQPDALDWDIGGLSEDVGKDTFPNTGDEGENDGRLQSEEDFNGNGILDNSMLNEVGWFAISHRRETWPEYWVPGTYPGDDRTEGEERSGVRAGKWNGEFGSYLRADQESYYVMDDRENDEFEYYPFDDEDSRRDWPDGRRGLGMEVSVRTYQWSSRLSEDILISIYDIENKGKDIDKCVVGMYVDPDLGGSLSGDDASFDNEDDITYAFNIVGISNQGLPIGYFGFAFLESPGLPKDGIDNDHDGMIDESQNNGIDDDGDWVAWEDENQNAIWDNEDINNNGTLDVGEDANSNGVLDIEPLNDDLGSDGLGPDFNEYTGPDPDGTQADGIPNEGEPNFDFTDNDESDQVGLTSFYLRDVDNTMANDERYWDTEISPGVFNVRPGYQRDIAWTYGSGFVKFSEDEKKHRYAIALLFGNNETDILRNKRTMQLIYDNDYNFSKPPNKPILVASGGDGKVVLRWNDSAEKSKDPIYGKDFEAYYIYKSTDPNFDDIKTITDAYSNPLLFNPLAIYDKKDNIRGIHPVSIGSEVGTESDLGVSYNMGTDSGLKHYFVDTDVTNGRTYYYAVVSVDRGYIPSYYPLITDKENLLPISPTECSANIQTDLLGRAISTDRNTAIVTPVEQSAGWVKPELETLSLTHSAGVGTGRIEIEVINENTILSGVEYLLKFYDDGEYEKYSSRFGGNTTKVTLFTKSDTTAFLSITDPNENPLADEFIAKGMKINIFNDTTGIETIYWAKGNSTLNFKSDTFEKKGKIVPRDYEIRVKEMGADTSSNAFKVITNFQVWDVTEIDNHYKVKFRYFNFTQSNNLQGILSDDDKIQVVTEIGHRLWSFQADYPDSVDSLINDPRRIRPVNGDVLKIEINKPFDRYDEFTFSFRGNILDTVKAKSDLDNIYVVPDPYLVSSTLERKVINAEEGRGDRRIDFVNLPNHCTVSIFTVSGRFVRKIKFDSEIQSSRASWDLRTKDGLEIAPGIYFYVVEAPGIGNKIGRFAVIK